MRHVAARVRFVLLATAALVVGGRGVAAQTLPQLPVGKTSTGQVSERAPTIYRFTAPSAGVLSVAVRADADVTIKVTDEDGQVLPDGVADVDLWGNAGHEQVIVPLPERGDYRVHIAMYGRGSAAMDIGAGWIAMPGFARPSDADGRPSRATVLEVGQSHEDALDTDAGDVWDWFAITPATSGALTVIVRGVNDASPDLAIELYTAGDLSEYVVRSDDDLQGNVTNESATIDVTAGQKIYIRVLGATGDARGPYRIASSLIE